MDRRRLSYRYRFVYGYRTMHRPQDLRAVLHATSSGDIAPISGNSGEPAMNEYKGCLAAAGFNDSPGILHGRIVRGGSYPVATSGTPDAKQLRRELGRSIDEYSAWNGKAGVELCRTPKIRRHPRKPRSDR